MNPGGQCAGGKFIPAAASMAPPLLRWFRIESNMRPTVMVAESEPLEALSTRKLVLETAKFNVLTVHSNAEALECIAAFPNISAAVLVSEHKIACQEVAAAIRKSLPHLPIIVLTARIGYSCPGADYHLSSYKPEDLLDLLRKLFGDPRTRDPSAE